MGAVAVIGEAAKTNGYVLAGSRVLVAEDAPAARAAWHGLPADTSLVILTAAAAVALADQRAASPILTVVMPV